LEKYVKEIKAPPKCIDLFSKEVFTCHYDDNLRSVVKIMEQKNYSHVPVYNRDERFVGLLSESNILSRLANNNDIM
jgi:predicted transcriptional regulator